MDELEDPKETPEEMASNFTCAMFETPQAVLKGARHMVKLLLNCLSWHVFVVLANLRTYFRQRLRLAVNLVSGNMSVLSI